MWLGKRHQLTWDQPEIPRNKKEKYLWRAPRMTGCPLARLQGSVACVLTNKVTIL